MYFNFIRIDHLPRLAWCIEIEKNKKEVNVYHGQWVETLQDFFVEGAWDGPFQEGNFYKSLGFFGTGGKIKEGDYNYIPYQVDLLNMIKGMKYHNGSIPIDGGNSVYIYHYRNIVIDSNLNIEVEYKKEPPEFENFETYKNFIINTLHQLHENATSTYRGVKYSLISMISTGYDSPACTVLGMEIGLKNALTFRTARGLGVNEGPEDSAKSICDVLGINVKEFNRLSILDKDGYPEAEFVASGDLGQDFEIAALGKDLEGKILLVGYHGDTMWNVNKMNVTKDIQRGDAGGCCWVDFKFRTGYIFVPVPYIGCLSLPSINRLSKSKEMEPWRVWNRYDRPVARRIVEDKGVPRKMFGQKKKAISILLNSEKTLYSQMTKESVKSFDLFYELNKKRRNKYLQSYYKLMYKIYYCIHVFNSYPNRVLSYYKINIKLSNIISGKFSQNPGKPSFLVHWGISIIKNRYNIH